MLNGGGGGGASGDDSSTDGRDELAGLGLDGDDNDDLDAIMLRLVRAKPPPEVLKAAGKEYRKLRQQGGWVGATGLTGVIGVTGAGWWG